MASRMFRHILPVTGRARSIGAALTPRSALVVPHNSRCLGRPCWLTPVRTASTSTNETLQSYDRKWLRENCRCSACYNHSTKQRNVLFYDFKSEQLEITDFSLDENQKARITWRDGHVTDYHLDWLRDNSYPGEFVSRGNIEKVLWDGSTMAATDINPVSCKTFMNDSEGLKSLLRSLLLHGIGVVKDAEPTVEGTRKVVERVCHIQETFFGRMWSFTSDMAHADTAYAAIALGAHTDNTYLTNTSGIQVFQCMEHEGDGGETLLVDGFMAAEKLRKSDPDAFNSLSEYRVYHEYIDGDINHVRSLHPILTVHPVSKELESIRYNHYDRSPISTIKQHDLSKYYDALAELSRRITDPGAEYWIKLKPGIVLFVDNWRVLHGRSAFTGLRRMCGCYLPRDDWLDKARVLGMIP